MMRIRGRPVVLWRVLQLVVMFLAFVIALIITFSPGKATFDITAETEYVRYLPQLDPAQHWPMDSVSLFGAEETTPRVVSGDLRFTDPVQVTLERRSGGPLLVKLEPTRERKQEGSDLALRIGVFREHGGESRTLYENAVIEIHGIEGRSIQRGKPIVFAVRGSLEVGRSVQSEPDASLALLRSGKVTKFVRSLWGNGVVMAGSRELGIGDEVTIDRPLSPELGLVRVDERPAMSVAYRADARSVRVGRPGGSDYRIRMYAVERVLADPMLQALWTTLLFLFGCFTSLIGYSKGTQQSKADEYP
ncbi:hypothetical protein [Longimicrobium terrae]|uniref:Uncharacterized protein n=1 Tax=Longimicrobium terrae TaxID=1639882 RepID=A0A841GSM4_9BACT|nr:hypothetical protein [Longimicrobium terrae]MBB4635894.1 hypothetical protein [Longimicrobium terrae]MBB6070290.1 hypothetical protein [Longimicrobium terrae]NNC30793.1 hypothetical protein [Longimicrobium terrae]